MSPLRDPIRNLVYGATDQNVNRVIIDGRTVVEDGEVLGMDERVIAEELQRIGDHFVDAIPSRIKEGKKPKIPRHLVLKSGFFNS